MRSKLKQYGTYDDIVFGTRVTYNYFQQAGPVLICRNSVLESSGLRMSPSQLHFAENFDYFLSIRVLVKFLNK